MHIHKRSSIKKDKKETKTCSLEEGERPYTYLVLVVNFLIGCVTSQEEVDEKEKLMSNNGGKQSKA